MLNHARELAAGGHSTVLIGYRGPGFVAPAGIRLHCLDGGHGAPRKAAGLPFILSAGLRMTRLCLALLSALVRERPRVILLQNPPSFPTLTAAAWAASCTGAAVIIDWHNYGFSLLSLRLGPSHWLTRLARWYEFRAAGCAARHFCVSRAMRDDLLARVAIEAEVLYDRPLRQTVPAAPHTGPRPAGEPAPARQSPFSAVCPAGWTSDEDIELLLDALDLLPPSFGTVYITGDGPKRAELAPRMAVLRAKGVLLDTGYLPEADYAALLSRADLGLSLHRSSSGLDLAMKVVDLFGAGIPVCAWDYSCVREQIEDGVTGFLFRSAPELARLLASLSSDPAKLRAAREAVRREWKMTWDEEWNRVAGPAFGAPL